MNQLRILINILFRRKFLMFSYILIVGVTFVWVTQTEIAHENNITNTSVEPFVTRSLFLSNMRVRYADKTEEEAFPGIKICERMAQMKTAGLVSFFTWVRYNEFFKNGCSYSIPYRATDHRYWQIMKFDFIQGRPYSKEDVEKSRPLIVLSESMRNQYFKKSENPLGKRITINGKDYMVCGVVKNVPSSSLYAYSEYWIPYTVWQGKGYYPRSNGLLSVYVVQVLAKSTTDFNAIHQEYQLIMNELKKENKPNCETIDQRFGTRGYLLFGDKSSLEDYTLSFSDYLLHSLQTLWFIMIPALALMCINFARTSERSVEIGVRMALGADRQMIKMQYIKENAVIILLGMIPGILLGYLFVYWWPDEYLDGLDVNHFTFVELPFNLQIFFQLLMTFIIFLCASILIPIHKLKLQKIASLLKGGNL